MKIANLTAAMLCCLFVVAACNGDDNSSNEEDTGSDTDPATAVAWCDETTDLCWQLELNQSADWYEAVDYCDNLVLDDHDDWYLPTVDELRSLIRGCSATVTGGECPIVDGSTDDEYDIVCYGCDSHQGPENIAGCYWENGMGDNCSDTCWSSSEDMVIDPAVDAWRVSFDDGAIADATKTAIFSARCVRSLN